MSKSSKLTATMDAEQAQFAADVLASIQQAKRGDFPRVHTPETITERRAGRSDRQREDVDQAAHNAAPG